jgi:hypothetical protein
MILLYNKPAHVIMCNEIIYSGDNIVNMPLPLQIEQSINQLSLSERLTQRIRELIFLTFENFGYP